MRVLRIHDLIVFVEDVRRNLHFSRDSRNCFKAFVWLCRRRHCLWSIVGHGFWAFMDRQVDWSQSNDDFYFRCIARNLIRAGSGIRLCASSLFCMSDFHSLVASERERTVRLLQEFSWQIRWGNLCSGIGVDSNLRRLGGCCRHEGW